jgi:hypothetical protein
MPTVQVESRIIVDEGLNDVTVRNVHDTDLQLVALLRPLIGNLE